MRLDLRQIEVTTKTMQDGGLAEVALHGCFYNLKSSADGDGSTLSDAVSAQVQLLYAVVSR